MIEPLFGVIPKAILDIGIDLSSLYGYAYSPAFYSKDALKVIDILTDNNIATLGGDVYHKNGETLSFGNGMDENWYTDFKHGETFMDYLKRANLETKKYILDHINNTDYIYNFILVDADKYNKLQTIK